MRLRSGSRFQGGPRARGDVQIVSCVCPQNTHCEGVQTHFGAVETHVGVLRLTFGVLKPKIGALSPILKVLCAAVNE